MIRRSGRADEGSGLENRRRETYRGFESHLLRQAWGLSSVGRAPALHAGGHRFDPGRLHYKYLSAWHADEKSCGARDLYTRLVTAEKFRWTALGKSLWLKS